MVTPTKSADRYKKVGNKISLVYYYYYYYYYYIQVFLTLR